jgi:hypothetical protein
MANESGDVRDTWQSQQVEAFRMPLDVIRGRIEKFDRNIRRRHYIGYAVCLFVIGNSIWWVIIFPNLIQRIGALLTILGTGYLGYQLLLHQIQKKTSAVNGAEMGNAASTGFYRANLERQRDFHRGIWFWSRLVIFVPGPFVFCLGTAIAHPETARQMRVQALIFAFLAALAVPLNLGMARKYQRQIDELDALRKDRQ